MQQISSIANISRKKLICAIGIQDPIRRLWREIDTEATGCLNCPNRLKNNDQFDCSDCPKRIFIERYEYINERNKYGNTSTLKSFSLKLYILLHYFRPNTSTGLIKDISILEISNLLGCHKKTIISNLNLLYKYGYILFGRGTTKNLYHIIIKDYSDMFKPAREGGRGYISITDDLLDNILQTDKINDLRCLIRFVDDALYNEVTGIVKSATATISYQEMRRRLPQYVKPGIIKKSISKVSNIFTKIINMGDGFQVTLDDIYCGRKVKEKLLSTNEPLITEFISSLNSSIHILSACKNYQVTLPLDHKPQIKFFELDQISTNIDLPVLLIGEKDKKDLLTMSTEYSLEAVFDSIKIVYRDHICRKKKSIKNLGSLIRQCIRKQAEFKLI